MILTSNYESWKAKPLFIRPVSISEDKGESASYKGETRRDLAWQKDFNEPSSDKVSFVFDDQSAIREYVKFYYNDVLIRYDAEELFKSLDNHVILDYEPSDKFSARHIIAAYFELLLGEDVYEATSEGTSICFVSRPKDIKPCLESVIRATHKIKGFKSLRAWYLNEQIKVLQKKAAICQMSFEPTDCIKQKISLLKQVATFIESCEK